MALAMVFTMLAPMNASANDGAKPFKQNGTSEGTMQLKAAIAEQLDLLEGGSSLHKDLQDLSGNEEIAVIIHLSEKPVALEQGIQELAGKTFTSADAAKAEKKVQAQHTFFKKEINANKISFKEGFSYSTVLNGFSATVKADDLKKLLDIKGVTLVEPDATVYATEDTNATVSSEPVKDGQIDAAMNTSISFLGIEKLWKEGFEGQGIKVAVLDTGIDANHPEFAGIYKGGKNFIPNSSTYTKTRAADDASETLPSERPAGTPEFNATGSSFYTSHGTHVAGTIAAIGANEYGIKGIAPKVDLYMYRVLGAYGSGSTSGIVKAIDTAVIEEMDVINLSLGGGANSETDSGSFAINNAMMAGTISVLATGNSGPNRGTMGTPATSRLGIAVGNTTNPETMFNGQVNVTVGNYNLTKQLQLMGTTFGKDLATQLQGEYDVVAVPGNGEAKDYQGVDVKGKVALISRGSIAFVDKIAFAQANGAVATIIHNLAGGSNAPNASGTFLGDSFAFIPTFDMSQTDGDAIRAALKGGAGTVKFGNFGSTNTAGDEVNSSSSRGPSTPNFDIKPDVSAPGTNIMSTIPMYKADFPDAVYNEAYDRKTGTSMATPHIAGIAALVKQANPTWNAFDVKVALSNTAKILDKAKFDIFAQGAGRVDAYAAAHPNVLAYAIDKAVLDASGSLVDNLKGTVTFGPQPLTGNISVTKQILVKDKKGAGGNYNVTVDVTKSFGDAKVTVDKPTFTLAGEQLLNINLTASKATAPNGSEILGFIRINGGGSEISLPFAADFSGVVPTAITNMAISEKDLSFNGDGVKDSALLSFTLTGDVATNYIELWDIMNPDGGEYGDGYIGYLHASNSLAKGSYTLPVAGQYKPWSTAPATTIPDGLYTIDFSAQAASGVVGDYVGPIVVKTTKPAITGAVTEKLATGQVTDKYIDYNEELYLYGMDFDLNEKLHASYIATINGETADAVKFDLAQDGSFSFPVTAETEKVTVVIADEAGNVGEALIYEKGEQEPELGLTVSPGDLSLKVGQSEQLKVIVTREVEGNPEIDVEDSGIVEESTETEVDGSEAVEEGTETNADDSVIVEEGTETETDDSGTVEEGTKTDEDDNETDGEGTEMEEVDVTADATYSSSDETVATVSVGGKVTAIAEGEATITVSYEDMEETVEVVVEAAEEPEAVVSLSVDKTDLSIEKGKTATVKVTETTTIDGESTEADVTTDSAYASSDDSIASVKSGVITAIAAGKTTITITHGTNTKTVNVTVTNPVAVDPGNGGGGGSGGGSGGGGYIPSTPSNPTPVEPGPVKPTPVVPAPVTPITFTDTAGHWAELYIQQAATMGIFSGYSDGTFKPNNNLTRAQAASMMVRALGLHTDEAAPFSDIANYDDATKAEIAAAYKYGIIKGNKGSFNPADKVTRAQIALMIARAYEYKTGSKYTASVKASFSDYGNYNAETVNAISMLSEFGVVSGFEGKFMPNDPTTRAQAAKIFVKLMEKISK